MTLPEPRGKPEEREDAVGVEEEGEVHDPAVGDLEDLERPGLVSVSSAGLYCPKAGAPFAAIVGMTRDPRQPAPGPTHQRSTSSRPFSHRSYGGIDCVASSWISETSASMS